MRTAVTDDQGRYQVVNLQPGTYTVSFMLPGFNSFKREGIQVTSSGTLTVNAELRVGDIEQSITVLNANPVLSLNQNYGQAWLTPTNILAGRLFKISGQVDF